VASDSKGNFEFSTVPPGRYLVSAERDGYFRQEHFQKGYSGQPESILTLTENQRVVPLTLALTEVPPITGIIYGADGQRLAAAAVHAYKLEYTPYGRQLSMAASELSHEGGEYRLFHLVPGNYLVSAGYSEQAIQSWKSRLKLTPNLSSPDEGYSTVYYPSEVGVVNAKWINLNHPREADNVDIRFRKTEYYRFTVKVTLPPPAPTLSGCPCLRNPKVALLPIGADLDTALDYRIQGKGTDFFVDRLASGDYVLVVVADVDDGDNHSVTRIVSDTRLIRVIKDTDVSIDAQHPFDIPGNVTLTTSGRLPQSMQIQLVRIDQLSTQTIAANVDSSGNFTLSDVGPGVYDVFLRGMPANAFLRDAGLANSDRQMLQVKVSASLPVRQWVVSPDGTTARSVSIQRLSASLGLSGATAGGRVTDALRKAFPRAEVVLVPASAAVRTRKDRYYVSSSDASGAFQFTGVAPGAYTAFAFQEIEPGIYYDPDFNAQIAPRGTRVNVDTGLGGAIELTVITIEDLARYIR
jgi:hypothetical protein